METHSFSVKMDPITPSFYSALAFLLQVPSDALRETLQEKNSAAIDTAIVRRFAVRLMNLGIKGILIFHQRDGHAYFFDSAGGVRQMLFAKALVFARTNAEVMSMVYVPYHYYPLLPKGKLRRLFTIPSTLQKVQLLKDRILPLASVTRVNFADCSCPAMLS